MFLISMGSCTAHILPSDQRMVHRWKGYTKHNRKSLLKPSSYIQISWQLTTC